MERSRTHRKSRSSRRSLNFYFSPRDYPCRDTATGALRPVPPGQTRAERFCPSCTADKCLLDRDRPRRVDGPGRAENNAAFLQACRRDGVNTRGLPLARRCWNCAHIRRLAGVVPDAYVCLWRWRDRPRKEVLHAARSRKTMLERRPSTPKHGCGGTAFVLRRGPIEEWESTQ